MRALDTEDALVLVREDFDEERLRVGPVLENPRGARAAGQVAMAREQGVDFLDVVGVDQWLEIHAGLVAAARGEVALIVVDVGDAAAHAGGEVAAGGTENDGEAVGHVFAAVIADAFDDGGCAGVADSEALAGDAVEEDFAAGCAVEDDVADEDALFGQEARGLGRIGDDAAAGEPFAEIVVGVAFKLERDALRNECAEALAGRAAELEVERAVGQSRGTEAARDGAAQHGADGAVHVANGEARGDRRLRFKRGLGLGDERMVERGAEAVILAGGAAARDARGKRRSVEDRREIDALRFPMRVVDMGLDFFNAADHFVDGAEAEFGHVLAHLLGDEEEEVDDVLGRAGEALAKNGVLGGDADGASIQVALAHHDATH